MPMKPLKERSGNNCALIVSNRHANAAAVLRALLKVKSVLPVPNHAKLIQDEHGVGYRVWRQLAQVYRLDNVYNQIEGQV